MQYKVLELILIYLFINLEADISGREIVGQNSDRSGSVSTQLLTIRSTVTGPVVPLYHRHVPPRSLKCYVRLPHRHHHLLSAYICIYVHVVSTFGFNGLTNSLTGMHVHVDYIQRVLYLCTYMYVCVHVISWTDPDGDVERIVLGNCVYGGLNGLVITRAVNVDRQYTVAGGSDPVVTMVLGRGVGGSVASTVVVVKH